MSSHPALITSNSKPLVRIVADWLRDLADWLDPSYEMGFGECPTEWPDLFEIEEGKKEVTRQIYEVTRFFPG